MCKYVLRVLHNKFKKALIHERSKVQHAYIKQHWTPKCIFTYRSHVHDKTAKLCALYKWKSAYIIINWLENNLFRASKHQNCVFPSYRRWEKNTPTFRFMNMHINTCAENHKHLRITHGPLWRGPLVHWLRACIFTPDTKAKSGFSKLKYSVWVSQKKWFLKFCQYSVPWFVAARFFSITPKDTALSRLPLQNYSDILQSLLLTGRRYRIIELRL